jgi:hypothetical protein
MRTAKMTGRFARRTVALALFFNSCPALVMALVFITSAPDATIVGVAAVLGTWTQSPALELWARDTTPHRADAAVAVFSGNYLHYFAVHSGWQVPRLLIIRRLLLVAAVAEFVVFVALSIRNGLG